MFENKVRIVMLKGAKGDPGESGDYAELTNKPQINGVTLNGNKLPSDLGLMTQTQAQQQQQAINSFEDEVNYHISGFRTELDAQEAAINDAIEGFENDMEILGARTQTITVSNSDFFLDSPVGCSLESSTSQTIQRNGNVISVHLDIVIDENPPQDGWIYIPIKTAFRPKSGSQKLTIYGRQSQNQYKPIYMATVHKGGTIGSTMAQTDRIAFYMPGTVLIAGSEYYIYGTYICDDVETIYSGDPSAVVLPDGYVTWSKLAQSTKEHGLTYLTTAPTEDNTDGGLKLVVLSEVPENKYDGYLYIIVGA